MTSQLTMPQQNIWLQLADPFTTADFTDITPLVKKWSGAVAGRQHELQLFQPGQVALTMESNLNGGRFNPWNTLGPYYNVISQDDAAQVQSNGTWPGGTTNCTLGTFPTTPPVTLDIGYALELTCNGTSPSSIITDTNVYPVVAGRYYSAMCSFLTSVTARACTVGISWYTSSNTLISTTTSSSVNDNTSTWTKASLLGTKAPATAAYAAIKLTITGASNNEVHWACRAALFNYTGNVPNTAWAPGQRGLVPARPIYCTATWNSVEYPIWSMYVSNFTPQYGQVKSEQVINCADGMALLSLTDISANALAKQMLADGAQSLWQLNDAPGASLANDSGPLNNDMFANEMAFGQASPVLTTDDTIASVNGAGVMNSSAAINPGTGGGTLELIFACPPVGSSQSVVIYSSNNAIIFLAGNPKDFEPTDNLWVSSANYAGGGGYDGVLQSIFVPNLMDGQYHLLDVTWTAIVGAGSSMNIYLDGDHIGFFPWDTVNSQAMFEAGTQFSFGACTPNLTYWPSFFQSSNYMNPGNMGYIAYYDSALGTSTIANHWALFNAGFEVQYSGDRIGTILDLLGWPANLQNLDTGQSQVQGATTSLTQTTALSYLQTIESTEMGALFVNQSGQLTFYERWYIIQATAATVSNGTFTNQPSPGGTYYRYLGNLVPAMDDTDLWNDVPAQRNGGVLQRWKNALSILQYGQRSLSGYTGELQTTDTEVLSQAQWLVQQYHTPYTRVRQISVSSISDAGKNFPQMLGRGIFDLITVIWNPIDQSTVYFDQSSLIESIHHDVTPAEWITTWGLSPAETQTSWMVLNDATRGQLSEGNRLAY